MDLADITKVVLGTLLRHDLLPGLLSVCLFSPMFLQFLEGFLELSCSLSRLWSKCQVSSLLLLNKLTEEVPIFPLLLLYSLGSDNFFFCQSLRNPKRAWEFFPSYIIRNDLLKNTLIY